MIAKQVGQRLLLFFLAGVFAIFPLVVTVAIVIWVAGFLEGFVGPETGIGHAVSRLGFNFASEGTLAYIVGWVVVMGIVFLLGVVVETGAKRIMQSIVDAVINRVPLINGIYNTSKQLVSMLDKQEQADLKGMSVVFCLFGENQGAGFLALLVSPQKFLIDDKYYQIVIVPTAPVPFGGGLLFVPTDAIQHADMSVDGLMSIYVSMGVTAPQFIKQHPDEEK